MFLCKKIMKFCSKYCDFMIQLIYQDYYNLWWTYTDFCVMEIFMIK